MTAAQTYDPVVSEASLEGSLDWLRDHAKEMGKAKERAVKASHMLKHIEAIEFKKATDKGAEARKATARTSPRYLAAIVEDAEAAGEYQRLVSLREAAALRIEVWRSEQANYRAMKI